MKWTTDKPTEPRWYWYKFSRHSEEKTIIRIIKEKRKLKVMWSGGGGQGTSLDVQIKAYPGAQFRPIEEPTND